MEEVKQGKLSKRSLERKLLRSLHFVKNYSTCILSIEDVFLLFNRQLSCIEVSRLIKSRFYVSCTLKASTCFYSEVHKSFLLYILRFPISRLVPPVLTIDIIIIIIIIIYLSWSWTTCWPVPVSRIQKSLQRSTMIPSASWTVVFHYPG